MSVSVASIVDGGWGHSQGAGGFSRKMSIRTGTVVPRNVAQRWCAADDHDTLKEDCRTDSREKNGGRHVPRMKKMEDGLSVH